ncbi:MAG: RecQ family ATP-dependent DNA helicase [Arachidicoccus sp.]|nr:RecQ family ATP-dependent DNA helicase [Arachidicoccus sp.]
MQTATDILKQYWHFSSFRGEQESIINAVLEGKDALASLPTGGGKSICFQVPAMMKEGVCIVITPLVALMKDQVENLLSRGIAACAVYSGLSKDEVWEELSNATKGKYKFLYLSPERLDTNAFKSICNELNVNLIAVDEAHCISQWGYDFRPAYLQISELRKYFPDVPVIALTASATPTVQKDIINKLLFKKYSVFQSSFQRKNLEFETKQCDNKFDSLCKFLSGQTMSAIVYCKSRRIAQDISKLLNMKNISADFYHAGLSQEVRNTKQNNWMQNKTRVIVCTNAFGMGIDKPDVERVIHYDIPYCLENYYQEAGRAGRNNAMSKAILLYTQQDLADLRNLKDIRFPGFSEIKKTYQNICDFLQIPSGTGEGNFYDFDFNTFIKNFRLNAVQTIYCIKALEQSGFMTFNENIFLPSKVGFTIDKESLYDFEKSYSQYEPLIKCLLRNYEGIVSYRVSVFEKQIAKLLHQPEDSVKQQLRALHHINVLEYLPQKETPQLFFLKDRAPVDDILFDHAGYLERKKIFSDLVDKMLQYVHTKECRSKFIAQYFGDANALNCGICDNCKQPENKKLSAKEFKIIASEIMNLLNQNMALATKNIIKILNNYSPENIKQTLRTLQSEEEIKIDLFGMISKY